MQYMRIMHYQVA